MSQKVLLRSVVKTNWLLRRFLTTESSFLSDIGSKHLGYNEKEGYVMKSPYGSVQVPNITIDQYVWKNMSKWPNHIAIQVNTVNNKYVLENIQ